MIKKVLYNFKKWGILSLSIALLAFATSKDNKSDYNLPFAIYSITSSDIDLDGDMDIVTGHKTIWGYEKPAVSIMENNTGGNFIIKDTSIAFTGSQENIIATQIDADAYPDLVCFSTDFPSGIIERYIRILYNKNNNFHTYKDFSLNSSEIFNFLNTGDINGDGFTDVVVISTINQFWGILYNDKQGNLLPPEYHQLDYNLQSINCGNLNKDNKEDIVIAGYTEIFFPTNNGFDTVLIDVITDRVQIVDFDQDGDSDIIGSFTAFVGYTRIHLIENKGNKEFMVYGPFDIPQLSYLNFQVADFNQDNLPDLFFNLMDNENLMILYNTNNFTLSDPQLIPTANYGEYLRYSTCADFDGNGYPDIATTRYLHANMPANVSILFNDGKGNFQDNPISGINETINKSETISAFPNPFKQFTNIRINTNITNNYYLDITNINGQLIKRIEKNEINNNIYHWNAKDKNGKEVTPGIYLISLHTGGQVFTQKLVYMN